MGDANFYWADLHIHSALSPCADNLMTPKAIVDQARREGLSIIALTDHNTVLNCPAILSYSSENLLIIPGMELQTREEVHILCLFEKLDDALNWHHFIWNFTEQKPNQVGYFGSQLIFDSQGGIVDEEPNLLLTSTNLRFEEIFREINNYHGIAIPAHIDRPSFSVLSNLGFLPLGLDIKTIEISAYDNEADFREKYPEYRNNYIIQSSDAHRITEIGRGRTGFHLSKLCWSELKDLLK